MLAILLVSLVAVVAQIGLLRLFIKHFESISPVGDEAEYLNRGKSPDPYSPTLYIRVPLLPALSLLAHQRCQNPEECLRLFSMLSMLTTVLILIAMATSLYGWQVGLLMALLTLLQPELLIYSRHIWPEAYLSLCLTVVTLCLVTLSPGFFQAIILGAVAATAFLIRFDQLVILPAVLLTWMTVGYMPDWRSLLCLTLPLLVSWLLLSVRNWRLYGIPWPDTTWVFNLRVAEAELVKPSAGSPVMNGQLISHAIAAVSEQEKPIPPITHIVSSMRRRGGRFALQVILRGWAYIGPDTFVRQRLFPPTGAAYTKALPMPFERWLQWAFPLLFSFAAVLALLGAKAPVWGSLIVASMLVSSLVFTRTRFRAPVIPLLLFWLVPEGLEYLTSTGPLAWYGWLVPSLLLSYCLVRFPSRLED